MHTLGEKKEKIFEVIDMYANLPKHWDGHSSGQMPENVRNFTKKFLERLLTEAGSSVPAPNIMGPLPGAIAFNWRYKKLDLALDIDPVEIYFTARRRYPDEKLAEKEFVPPDFGGLIDDLLFYLTQWRIWNPGLKNWATKLKEETDLLGKLTKGWNSYEAPPISPLAIERAKEFIDLLAEKETKIPAPIVGPLPSGGVGVIWRFRDRELEVRIDEKEISFLADIEVEMGFEADESFSPDELPKLAESTVEQLALWGFSDVDQLNKVWLKEALGPLYDKEFY